MIWFGDTDMLTDATTIPLGQVAVRVALPAVVGPVGSPTGGLGPVSEVHLKTLFSRVWPCRFAVMDCARAAWDRTKLAAAMARICGLDNVTPGFGRLHSNGRKSEIVQNSHSKVHESRQRLLESNRSKSRPGARRGERTRPS